jgi:hypothetical protein
MRSDILGNLLADLSPTGRQDLASRNLFSDSPSRGQGGYTDPHHCKCTSEDHLATCSLTHHLVVSQGPNSSARRGAPTSSQSVYGNVVGNTNSGYPMGRDAFANARGPSVPVNFEVGSPSVTPTNDNPLGLVAGFEWDRRSLALLGRFHEKAKKGAVFIANTGNFPGRTPAQLDQAWKDHRAAAKQFYREGYAPE